MEKEEFLKLLPKLIQEDNEVKGAIITALSGVMATKDDIERVIRNSNQRFEEVNQRFEEINQRFEEVNQRFEGVNQRFEEVYQRFEGVNQRFEEVNQRFEEAKNEREDIKDSMIILRETVGKLIQETATIKMDINEGNKEILDYLKKQFEEE